MHVKSPDTATDNIDIKSSKHAKKYTGDKTSQEFLRAKKLLIYFLY